MGKLLHVINLTSHAGRQGGKSNFQQQAAKHAAASGRENPIVRTILSAGGVLILP